MKKKPQKLPARELRAYRRELERKRQDLLQAYFSAKGDSRDRQSDGTEDYIDYAVSSYDREFLLSLTELEQRQLMLVEEAIERLNRPREFGRCANCDTMIPSKRLEVQPWARYCVRCQELDEQGLLVTDSGDQDEDELEDEPAEDLEIDGGLDTDEPIGVDGDADRLVGN